MSDVVSRLLAAIDEHTKAALSISAGRFAEGMAGRQVDPDLNRYLDTVADPDAVIRLCQAHRDIVALHAPEEPWSGAGRVQCAHCASLCHSETGLGCELNGDAPFPCETVILLARGYGVEDGED